MPLAHSANSAGETHDLREHLEAVACIAADFATPFGSADWARAAGLWHDLGKNATDFQARLKAGADTHKDDDVERNAPTPDRVEHAIAGAIHAGDLWWASPFSHAIAAVIAGHHAGMPDSATLRTRLDSSEKRVRLTASMAAADRVIPDATLPDQPAHITATTNLPKSKADAGEAVKCRYEFWTRMLFSCLVDADWLDTETHFEQGKPRAQQSAPLRGNPTTPAELLLKLNTHLAGLTQSAATEGVNRVRAQVLADCRAAGRDCQQGVFTLTAPTGSGKTLAGMAFALEHTVRHKLKRVIVVLPFTSIIDQNAKVYRDVFGADNVIDHHSAIDPVRETDRNRVACENWDAPVVVTTSVQFLESLLSNRPAACRKLHNVCESVVIFDEVQTLPAAHLIPIVDALKELVRGYKVTLVLSTATQPALRERPAPDGKMFAGFGQLSEIVRDVPAAFRDLDRVRVEWPTGPAPAGKLDAADADALWVELAAEVSRENRVLVVTHSRKDCRQLAKLVPDAIHLSALMCPAHRLKVLDEIRAKLAEEDSQVRVVSTQLVEAGVDLDFPVVYRAEAGFDSLAQAAGRCNRNGTLGQRGGRVVVFRSPGEPPDGMPRLGKAVAAGTRSALPTIDPLDPDIFEDYFSQLYRVHGNLDQANIQSDRALLNFKTVAENFKLIDPDGSTPVVVCYGDAVKRLADVPFHGPNRKWLRSLQPFTVTIHQLQVERMIRDGVVRLVAETVYAIDPMYECLYSERYGLDLTGEASIAPQKLVS